MALLLKFLSVFTLISLLSGSLYASLNKKSAILYYGEHISYPMVGIHDYIIVQPELLDTRRHGFSLYKDKIYAYISIGEIDNRIKEFNDINKSWIVSTNDTWKSKVLDIKNKEYQEFIFKNLIEPRRKEGFKNFFFDTVDSYYLYSKTQKEQKAARAALVHFIEEFHKRYPESKLILNRGFDLIDKVHNFVTAILFESYYKGISGEKLTYKDVSQKDRDWLDEKLKKVKSYGVDLISVEYLPVQNIEKNASGIVDKIEQKGMIPYVTNKEVSLYGVSSKNAIKREILTLVDEHRLDRTLLEAHEYGATVFEYLGYIQKLYNIDNGLPSLDSIRHYKGVVVWLQDEYKDKKKFALWIDAVKNLGIKIVFAGNFGGLSNTELLDKIGIKVKYNELEHRNLVVQDQMVGYEIEPSLSLVKYRIKSKDTIKPLLVYKLENGKKSTLSAITSWGGYAIEDGFIVEIKKDNLWVINPFTFFSEALELEPLIVPDVTTQNGKRLLFSHIDGDGIMNKVEGIENATYSGEVIYRDILSSYKIPHSVSVIGAEIDKDGLYPKLSQKMTQIAKQFYALDNVEAATHTYTHPFYWGMIDENGSLPLKYRLKVKNYKFSIKREIKQSLSEINKNLVKKGRPLAQTVFWSGDCAPRTNALSFCYANKVLNINGGDTYITKLHPWLSYIAPLGLERDGFYQVYTGAQNENVFTNEWLGPFWGFKRVVQTFEMTNSPRRFKPIDIYYHLYSGSKKASLKALKYVFDWAIKQDVMPIYTSAYIPKVMDFYEVSMAKEGNSWLVDGMRDLKTLRVENPKAEVALKKSSSVVGIKHFENHTYISLDPKQQHKVVLSSKTPQESYLVSANANVIDYKRISSKKTHMVLKGEVAVNATFSLQDGCKLNATPTADYFKNESEGYNIAYNKAKKVTVDIVCK